jgi:hypothetical protein
MRAAVSLDIYARMRHVSFVCIHVQPQTKAALGGTRLKVGAIQKIKKKSANRLHHCVERGCVTPKLLFRSKQGPLPKATLVLDVSAITKKAGPMPVVGLWHASFEASLSSSEEVEKEEEYSDKPKH